MRVYIPIHSIVDVITNSSSVIYSEASGNAVELIKAVIDEVLEAAGSDKRADDLFNFSIVKRPTDLLDWVMFEVDPDEHLAIPDIDGLRDFINNRNNLGFKELRNIAQAWIDKNAEELDAYFGKCYEGMDQWDDGGRPLYLQYLLITTKDGKESQIAKNALGMFEHTESYDG